MVDLYNQNDVATLSHKLKGSTLFAVLTMIVAVAICVTLCLVVTDKTVTLFTVICCVVFWICGWVSLYTLFTRIIPTKNRIAFCKRMFNAQHTFVKGKVSDISRQVTLFDGRKVNEIAVCVDSTKYTFYWDLSLNVDIPWKVDDVFVAMIADNHVFGYEVQQ